MNQKPVNQKRVLPFGFPCRWFLCLIAIVLLTADVAVAETRAKKEGREIRKGWSSFVRGGFVHQLDADIDGGGNFNVNRLFVQGGPAYTTEKGTSISLAVGYGLDAYDFSGGQGFGGGEPWTDIHSLRLGIPVRWRINRQWVGFVSPTLRTTGEKGADYGEALTGGGFAGFSYRFSDRLSLGPGIGVLTQIEDSTQVIPILVINWKITQTFSLSTGQGVGATLGPGLALDWRPNHSWNVSFGGRYESLRFRLDDQGEIPNGVGDDRAFPVFLSAGYSFSPLLRISVIGGMEVGGELRLEDENGSLISEENHNSTGFFGFTFGGRF